MLEETKLGHSAGGFSASTQALTPKGWKDLAEVTIEDDVIQWSLDGSMEFIHPVKVFSTTGSSTLKISNHQGHIYQEVSSNHRVVYERKGENKEGKAVYGKHPK